MTTHPSSAPVPPRLAAVASALQPLAQNPRVRNAAAGCAFVALWLWAAPSALAPAVVWWRDTVAPLLWSTLHGDRGAFISLTSGAVAGALFVVIVAVAARLVRRSVRADRTLRTPERGTAAGSMHACGHCNCATARGGAL